MRLEFLPKAQAERLAELECPTFEDRPWVNGPPLAERRVALISSAGLHRRDDKPFGRGAGDYRVIPAGTDAGDIIMGHVSTNYDRSGFQQDLNVVFPLDRLSELAAEGVIGSVAEYHYSFMGATDPVQMEESAMELAKVLQNDGVTAVVLVPV